MQITCDDCGVQYRIPDEKLTREVNKATCKKCGARLTILRSGIGRGELRAASGLDDFDQEVVNHEDRTVIADVPELKETSAFPMVSGSFSPEEALHWLQGGAPNRQAVLAGIGVRVNGEVRRAPERAVQAGPNPVSAAATAPIPVQTQATGASPTQAAFHDGAARLEPVPGASAQTNAAIMPVEARPVTPVEARPVTPVEARPVTPVEARVTPLQATPRADMPVSALEASAHAPRAPERSMTEVSQGVMASAGSPDASSDAAVSSVASASSPKGVGEGFRKAEVKAKKSSEVSKKVAAISPEAAAIPVSPEASASSPKKNRSASAAVPSSRASNSGSWKTAPRPVRPGASASVTGASRVMQSSSPARAAQALTRGGSLEHRSAPIAEERGRVLRRSLGILAISLAGLMVLILEKM